MSIDYDIEYRINKIRSLLPRKFYCPLTKSIVTAYIFQSIYTIERAKAVMVFKDMCDVRWIPIGREPYYIRLKRRKVKMYLSYGFEKKEDAQAYLCAMII